MGGFSGIGVGSNEVRGGGGGGGAGGGLDKAPTDSRLPSPQLHNSIPLSTTRVGTRAKQISRFVPGEKKKKRRRGRRKIEEEKSPPPPPQKKKKRKEKKKAGSYRISSPAGSKRQPLGHNP